MTRTYRLSTKEGYPTPLLSSAPFRAASAADLRLRIALAAAPMAQPFFVEAGAILLEGGHEYAAIGPAGDAWTPWLHKSPLIPPDHARKLWMLAPVVSAKILHQKYGLAAAATHMRGIAGSAATDIDYARLAAEAEAFWRGESARLREIGHMK